MANYGKSNIFDLMRSANRHDIMLGRIHKISPDSQLLVMLDWLTVDHKLWSEHS